MSTYAERKEERRRYYAQMLGRRQVACVSCSGSGVYDNDGSPPCGACEGTGRRFESREAADMRAAGAKDGA